MTDEPLIPLPASIVLELIARGVLRIYIPDGPPAPTSPPPPASGSEAELVICGTCGRKFPSGHSLRVHKGRSHPGSA